MPENTTQSEVRIDHEDIDPPETKGEKEWGFEIEMFIGVTAEFDKDELLKTVETKPNVIKAYIHEKPNVVFTDLDEETAYRIKINGWMVGNDGIHASKIGSGDVQQTVLDNDNVLGHIVEFCQPVGSRQRELEYELES